MVEEKINKKKSCWVNVDEVVHKLIYPALLGSMIYGFIYDFHIKDENECCWQLYFKIGIVIFYLLDYYHLYTFMEKSFPKRKGNPWCVCIDCAVAVLLTLVFLQVVPYLLLCILPFLFGKYARELITNKSISVGHFVSGVIIGVVIVGISFCSLVEAEVNKVFLISALILYYCVFIWLEQRKGTNDVDEYIELTSNKGNTYLMNITEEMKLQDNK
jgi:hypothetical protein